MTMIILVHSRQQIPNISHAFDVLMLGQLGCQIFFFCSGYLIMESYEKDFIYGNICGFATFVKKRYASIIPGYWLIILVTYALNSVALNVVKTTIGFATNRSFISIVCNLFLLQGLLPFCNNNVVAGGWFIGTTVLIYWATPLICQVMIKFKDKAILSYIPGLYCIVALIIARLLSSIGYNTVYENNGFFYFNLISQLPSFMLGCLLYIDYWKMESSSNICSNRSVFFGGLLICGAAVCYRFGSMEHLGYLNLVMPTMFTYGIYFVSRSFDMERTFGRKVPILRSIIWFGRNSYYVYLAHPFFVWSMPSLIFMIVEKGNMTIDPNIAYLVLLPVMFIGSAFFAKILQLVCDPFCRKLRNCASPIVR